MLIDIGPRPPAPFESAWMIFIKAIAFNLTPPRDLFQALALDNTLQSGLPKYWSSEWLNISEFSQSVNLPTWILRQAFVDQICLTPDTEQNIIRHCPECIGCGYHSVLFQFEILTHCPWHGCKLISCPKCSNAFRAGGIAIKLVRTISKKEFVYEVALSCGHFHFSTDGSLIVQDVDRLPLDTLLKRSLECICWLRSSSRLGAAGILVCRHFFADSSSQQTQLFEACLSHVESLIGSCAWRPKAAYVRPILKKTGFRISEVKNTVDALREGPKEYLALFKSIRRHIYKIYVKPHKKCWNEITHFDTLKLHALDVEGACSASSAYLAWLMSLQWDADTGHSQYARANFMQLKRNQCPVDAANVGLLWLLHFYSTWSGIERGCEECRLHRDRFSVEILSRMPPLTLGEDCILSYGARGIICGLCTSPASLKSLCARRCLRRLGRSAFINEQATWAIYHWGYEVKPNVLLRFWRGTHSKQGGLHSTVVAG